jgi:ribosomal protein L7/L12
MSHRITNDDRERIERALAAGDKIDAIKIYRLATGAGLAEAKHAVEAIEAGRPLEPGPLDAAGNDAVEAIQAALFAGRKIQAIKLYRESTGKGLKESKDFIEALEVELRRTDPTRFTAPAAKGCGTAMLVFLILIGCLAGALSVGG